jgi:hypothetical protein
MAETISGYGTRHDRLATDAFVKRRWLAAKASGVPFEKLRDLDAESVSQPHQCAGRGIPPAEFQVRQIGPLHGGSLGKLLSAPSSFVAERFDARGQLPQNLGFGDRQPSWFRTPLSAFVRSELQSGPGIPGLGR